MAMPGPFRSREMWLILLVGALLTAGALFALGFRSGGIAIGVLVWAVVIFPRPAMRLQDWLFERALSKARYDTALRLAEAMRDGAYNRYLQALAEFDVGLVLLAKGAAVDAERTFARIDRKRLRGRIRLVVGTYHALARLRAAEEGERRREAARDLMGVCTEAAEQLGDDANLLAARAESCWALNHLSIARSLIEESLQRQSDPMDPSPGERHLLLGKIASAQDDVDAAVAAWSVAASLAVKGPCVVESARLLAETRGAA